MKIFWITKDIAISGSIDDYNKLVDEGINTVINVRGEQHDDITELSNRVISYFWIPIPDHCAPRADQIYAFLSIVDTLPKKILVHCAVGKGRSATLVAIYLALHLGKSLEDALDLLKEKKPDVSLNPRQLPVFQGFVKRERGEK